MSGIQNFRSSIHGFNRKDVVNYIEYMNNKHNSQVEQLNSQLQAALSRPRDNELQARLEAAEAKIRELEAALAADGTDPTFNCTEQELEAYRRAERAERIANDRAQQIYEQANAILSDAAVQVDSAAEQIDAAAQKLNEQLDAYKHTVENAKATLHDVTATLGTIRPEEK